MKYVELNPVRAKLCRKPWRYAWSSAAAHVDEAGNGGQVQPAAQNVPVPDFRPVPDLLDLDKWFARVSGQEWRAKLLKVSDHVQEH